MITKYKPRLTPLIAIIARPFLSWNPSALTLVSVCSAFLFFIGVVTHIYLLSILSMAGFVFDMLDGYVARKQKKVSRQGAYLDSTLDRVSDFFLMVSFGFAHVVAWELVILVAFSSFFISYMRARAEATFGKDSPTTEGLMQRTERTLFIFVAFLLFLLFPTFSLYHVSLLSLAFSLILVLNCVTIIQRFVMMLHIKSN